MASVHSDNRKIIISLIGDEEQSLSLDDVSSFFYDFSNLYAFVRLAIDRNYSDFKFSNYVYYRKGKPLRREDLLYVETIRLESPLEVVTSVIVISGGAITAIWVLIQMIEKIYNIPLNREKLKLDTEKVRLEVEKLKREQLEANQEDELLISPDESMSILYRREAIGYIENAQHRLKVSPIKIKELDVTVETRKSDDKK